MDKLLFLCLTFQKTMWLFWSCQRSKGLILQLFVCWQVEESTENATWCSLKKGVLKYTDHLLKLEILSTV